MGPRRNIRRGAEANLKKPPPPPTHMEIKPPQPQLRKKVVKRPPHGEKASHKEEYVSKRSVI